MVHSMSAIPDTPAQHGISPDMARAGVRQTVAVDMERIFAPLPRLARPVAPTAPLSEPRRKRGLLLWAVALILIALLVAATVLLNPPRQIQAQHPATPIHPAGRLAPAAASPVAPAPVVSSVPTTEPITAQASPAAPVTIAPAEAKSATAEPRRGNCPAGATAAWCMHGAVMAADDRLRDAYAAAVRAGVDRTILVGVRNRKGGPGITRSDLLVINKTDLAPFVGASLEVMERDARRMRGTRPFVFTNMRNAEGLDTITAFIESAGGLAHSQA